VATRLFMMQKQLMGRDGRGREGVSTSDEGVKGVKKKGERG
jgi:hypothetical protein